MNIGTKVIAVLAALTAIEYIIATSKPIGQIPLILLIVVAKAALILIYFMHIGQLRNGEHS